jgi:hypothetical protein
MKIMLSDNTAFNSGGWFQITQCDLNQYEQSGQEMAFLLLETPTAQCRLFSHKEEWNYFAYRQIDGAGQLHDKQNMPGSKSQSSHVFSHMWKLELKIKCVCVCVCVSALEKKRTKLC